MVLQRQHGGRHAHSDHARPGGRSRNGAAGVGASDHHRRPGVRPLPGRPAGHGRQPRHQCRPLRRDHRRPHARPERARPARCAARIHHADLGLPGRAGRSPARG
ncbi:hypothetical protein G6F31_020699 [Rhizopus arrhizus]|nr:hypothetical protein G6F31_020699 [Rhizopus arrhizus]